MANQDPPTSSSRSAHLSATQIKAAIPKLQHCSAELDSVEITDWNQNIKNKLDALQARIEDTLIEVFGADTLEYQRFEVPGFVWSVQGKAPDRTPDIWIEGYRKAVAEAGSKINTAVEVLKEKLEDMGETSGGQASGAQDGLVLHPEIDRAAIKLYRDGHYGNAIGNAVKALNSLVRLRSGVDTMDGTKLMEHVFSPKNPVLTFNALSDDSDLNQQRGYMMMFSGAVAGLRNPQAHKLIEDDAERALEFIAFISLLAKLLDGADYAPETNS